MAAPNFGDVVKALEICTWIKRNCFDPTTHADVKYAEFKKDVTGLHRRLDQFQVTLETAYRHTQDAEYFQREADELIGDFKSTLQKCYELLHNHIKFDRGKPTPLDNAFWHGSAQPRINELRDRIQSHTHMIALIVEPVHLQISSRTLENTEFIIRLLTEPERFLRRAPLPNIPPRVEARLWDAIKPALILEGLDTTNIPLKEGIDVLSMHYRRSTEPSTNSEDTQAVARYLCVLKAHYLLKSLTRSRKFDALRPGHLYRQLLMQLEQGIAKVYAREDISQLNEEDINGLDDSDFDIWPEKKFNQRVQGPESTEPGEFLLAKLHLVPGFRNQKEELLIFKADDTTLRTVHSTTPFDNSIRPRDTVRNIDLHSDGLVPLYFMSSSEQRWNFQIVYGKTIVAYELQSRQDALDLQLAFTGFECVAYSEPVSFTVTYQKPRKILSSLRRDDQQTESGELQLWQWPSEGNSGEVPLAQRNSHSSSEKRSRRASSGYTMASKSFMDLDSNVVSVMQADNGREIIVSRLPPPPLLMGFTNRKGTYSIWQVDLSDLETVKSPHPKLITLRHRHQKPFTIWRLSVEEAQLASWDLCALVPASNGKVRGGQFTKQLDCTWLELEFPTLKRANEFKRDILNVLEKRVQQLGQQTLGRERAQAQIQYVGP